MNKSEAMKKALLAISGGLSSAFGDTDFDLPQGIQECFNALTTLDEDAPEWNGQLTPMERELKAERDLLDRAYNHIKNELAYKPTDNFQWGYRSALIGMAEVLRMTEESVLEQPVQNR